MSTNDRGKCSPYQPRAEACGLFARMNLTIKKNAGALGAGLPTSPKPEGLHEAGCGLVIQET